MPLGVFFWIAMFVWLLLSLVVNWKPWPNGCPSALSIGNSVLLFILFLLLGWKVFGPAIHG